MDRDQQIREMLAKGVNWREIGIQLGYVEGGKRGCLVRRFTPEEDQLITERWNAHVHVSVIAQETGRSEGTLRQRVLYLQKHGRLGSRDTRLTRMLRFYGADIEQFGKTPEEIVARARAAMASAKQQAKASMDAAKATARRIMLDKLRKDIIEGKDRDEAIFEARSAGLSLLAIGKEFDVTRERIRQICNRVALDRALVANMARAVQKSNGRGKR